ncbi:MAG: hypothetical protein Q8P67_12250, partial [archaeon]|nr:hypothetical protein [archaeon]
MEGEAVMMKAIILTEYGDESKLNVSFSAPQPRPLPGHVVLRVRACALSCHSDLPAREGHFDALLGLLPSSSSSSSTSAPPLGPSHSQSQALSQARLARWAVLGYEVSGEVFSCGEGVTAADCVVGDEFVGLCEMGPMGGLAEYVMLPLCSIVRKPTALSHPQAAACLLPAVVGYSALHYRIHAARGDTVMVMNGADETGHLVLQLAAATMGLRVITTASSDQQLNYLQDGRAHGSLVRIVDLRSEALVEAVLAETGGRGVDGIVDVLPRLPL